MSKEFEASILIRGDDDATPELLEFAVKAVMAKARRFPPSSNFDWSTLTVSADFYTANPKKA